MKGSVLVLLGCSALFFAAPSHSYSVKFISEEEQVANRQDTESGSFPPDVVTVRDAGGNETVETGGSTKPGNESVSEDAQTVKSKIRKRDTRSLDRDMERYMDRDMERDIGNMADLATKPVTPEIAVDILLQVGNYSGRCFKRLVQYLQELGSRDYRSEIWGDEKLSRSDMIKWLKKIQESMSACLRKLVGHMTAGEPPYDDDDTPVSVIPRSESDTFMVSELLAWITQLGTSLEKCFYEVISILEGKTQGPPDTVQRSSETISGLFKELMGMLSQFDVGTPAVEKPGESVRHYPSVLPGIDYYKKRNYDRRSGYRQYTNLPSLIEQRPPVGYGKEIRNLILPDYQGYRDAGDYQDYQDHPAITTLPDDVTAIPIVPSSLLDEVLKIIYSRIHGKAPPTRNIDAAPVEGLRGNANGVPGLSRDLSKRQSLINLGSGDPNFAQCIRDCMISPQ